MTRGRGCSDETIYLSLFVQSRGALRRDLQRQLRTGRAMRHPRAVRLPQGRGQFRDTVGIRERPAEAEDRAVPGHWEGDLIQPAPGHPRPNHYH
jgi:IS30 family transposase